MKAKQIVLIGVFALMSGALSSWFTTKRILNSVQEGNLSLGSHATNTTRLVEMPNAVAKFEAVDLVSAAELSVNSVVHVKTTIEGQDFLQINPYSFFFGQPEAIPRKGPDRNSSGSGVLLSSDGYIVTNNHVIDKANSIEVVLNDNRTYKAKLVGTDKSTDIALLKIEERDLPFIQVGNSDDVKLGEWVLAVGNPLNLNSTVTAGIVSAKGRNINILPNSNELGQAPIESFIQTDAAVNPGNSGGALVNTRGELVGINTAIKSPTGSFAGYSFAVPINIVKKVVDDLMQFGAVQRGYLGLSIRDIDSDLQKELKLNVSRGVYVNGLLEEGAAESAGIKEGDIILKIGTQNINSVPQLQEQVGRYRPGDEISVMVLRDGKEKNIPVILRNKFGTTEIVKKEAKNIDETLGVVLSDVAHEDLKRLRIQGGVQIEKMGNGKLKNAGVKQGFIITKVDKKAVKTKEDLQEILENKEGGILIEGVYPNGLRGFYGVGL